MTLRIELHLRTLTVVLFATLASFVGEATSASAMPPASRPALLVRYKATGEEAVLECAERVWKRGSRYAEATADRSESLDRWHARHDVQEVRAVFRSAAGDPLDLETQRLAERIDRALAKRSPGASNRLRRAAKDPVSTQEMARRLVSIYRVELAGSADLASAMDEFRQDPHVDFVQVDHSNELDFVADDPFLTTAGSWSQPYPDLWGLERIGAEEAWQTTRGAGQVVAVVDTGLDYAHPDIVANVWTNPGEDLDGNGSIDPSDWNGLDDDRNGFVDDIRGYDFAGFGELRPDGTTNPGDADPFDEHGHGTHVAGIVAATANNGIGIAGVAPEAKLMPLKGFPAEGPGRDSDLWRAVLYAVENGASVINASWSCSPACPENPLAHEVLAIADAAGVVFVTSAGNRAFDVLRNDPENSTSAITVGSIGADDALSLFSNRGWLVDVVAPGGGPSTTPSVLVPRRNILSLAASSLDELEEAFVVGGPIGEGYWRQAGTSMSAPHVAGAVALLRSVRPDASPADVRRLLRSSAEDIPPLGHDPVFGAGLLDLPALLQADLPDVELRFVSPAPGDSIDPSTGPALLRFVAAGDDLASYSLAFSKGLDTNAFVEIDRGQEFDGSEPFSWPLESIADGPVVLRLRAMLLSGAVIEEHVIVGVERNRPVRLSSGAFDERRPSISDPRVVWDGVVDGAHSRTEIRAGGFAGASSALSPITLSKPSSSTQHTPSLAGREVVWLERDEDSIDERVHGCRWGASTSKRCQGRLLVENLDGGRLDPIALEAGRLLWSPRRASLFEILGCLWRGGPRCMTMPIVEAAPVAVSRRLLDFDGRTLLLSTSGAQSGLEICRPILEGGSCTSQPVSVEGGSSLSVEAGSIDGSLLAFEFFPFPGSMLGLCQLDLDTAECLAPRLVETLGAVRGPHVSGRRIVWTEHIPGETPSIASCEWDPLTGVCPRIRLTGSAAPASAPRIDGNRVVWQDARVGPDQIFGLELPQIQLPARVALRPGQRRFVPISAPDPAGGLLDLELLGHSGASPDSWGAEIVARRHGRAALVIEVPVDVGSETAVWQVRGTGRGGLTTREAIEVSVSAKPRSSRSAGRDSNSKR